jgi:hypothetical protein
MRLSTIAVLVAVAVALGMLLAAVPNVEGVSAVSFFSGYLLGAGGGCLVGGLSEGILSLLNPLGPAPPPVLAAQILGMAMMGLSGSLFRRAAGKPRLLAVLVPAAGAVLTIVYDILTNYGAAVAMGRWRSPIPVLAAGIPLGLLHVISNAAIFGGVGAMLMLRHRPE